jgi:arylsulfatase A-like enzyme
MRILYIDVDSLRPDHLGCYGYHRDTSPNIDRLAREGSILTGLYASDTPCLPSRTGFFGGRFGSRTGVINHGGVCADLPIQGASRDFRSIAAENSLASALTRAGYRTASISPFPRRHSAYQMTYGFHETIDTGRGGLENADEIFAEVRQWLEHRAKSDNWFLHVNMWDPHTPYDTPASFGNPFAGDPIDGWLTPGIIEKQRASYGPHSAREVPHYDSIRNPAFWPWGVGEIETLDDAKIHMDGYDCGVRYADEYIGRIVNLLADAGVLDETAIVVSADHGENLGELNVWGDHQTADEFTNHIPAVIRWPGVSPAAPSVGGLHYHLDLTATFVDLAGGKIPDSWDGRSLRSALNTGSGGRERLLLSQGAWSLQRSMRWENWILIHTVDTGCKDFSEWMLFDLAADPHQTINVFRDHPEITELAGSQLEQEFAKLWSDCPYGDPFEQVKRESGPLHARWNSDERKAYLQRLESTGRRHHAEWLTRHRNGPRPADLAAY